MSSRIASSRLRNASGRLSARNVGTLNSIADSFERRSRARRRPRQVRRLRLGSARGGNRAPRQNQPPRARPSSARAHRRPHYLAQNHITSRNHLRKALGDPNVVVYESTFVVHLERYNEVDWETKHYVFQVQRGTTREQLRQILEQEFRNEIDYQRNYQHRDVNIVQNANGRSFGNFRTVEVNSMNDVQSYLSNSFDYPATTRFQETSGT